MNSCRSRPQVENSFKSSYSRSFEDKNVDHPLTHVRAKREAIRDVQNPIFQEKYSSTYNASFGYKSREGFNYYQRSSVNSGANLRRLHEEYVGNPLKPHETGLTTTGTNYRQLKPTLFPSVIQSDHPAKDFTCPMDLRGKDKFIIPIHEHGFYKLLDIYATINQLAHIDFFRNQRNRIAKKDDYCDEIGVTKNRGALTSNSDLYFNSQQKHLYRHFPKQFSRVPNSGNISTYNKDYKHVTTNLKQFEYNSDFPTLYKLTKSDIFTVPGMYCTEKCHLGTGWSIRAVIDIK